jgi:hypothetical protein
MVQTPTILSFAKRTSPWRSGRLNLMAEEVDISHYIVENSFCMQKVVSGTWRNSATEN